MALYEHAITLNNGEQTTLEQYKGKGFEILGFPCDQFGHQEPGSDEDIAEIKRTGRISFGQFERCIGEDGANLEQIGISLALKRIPEKIAAEMNAEDD